MKSVLQQLYSGEIDPADQYIPKTEKYKSVQQKQYQHYEDFVKKLESFAPSLIEEFNQIIDEQLYTVQDENSAMFVNGFRLGAKIAIEIYHDNINGKNDI